MPLNRSQQLNLVQGQLYLLTDEKTKKLKKTLSDEHPNGKAAVKSVGMSSLCFSLQ